MMLTEFETLTGIYPSLALYKVIEAAYYDFNGDKTAFSAAYKTNADGLAEKIQRQADDTQRQTEGVQVEKERAHEQEVAELRKQVARLQKDLEREQEWRPFEDPHNVSQADYEGIEAIGSRELSDDEAADMIAREFGFDRSKITIVHEVSKTEIDRHGQVRRVGTIPRKALFEAWDWNYICFNVHGNATMGYEMHNGELQMYWG